MLKANFADYTQYLQAKTFGATTLEEYNLVLKYKAPNYEFVFAIEQGGFISYELYELARQEGYLNFEDYLNKYFRKNI